MRTKLAAALGAAALIVSAGSGAAWAKHGADDPAGHDRNDDRGGRVGAHLRHGADDGPNHDRNDDHGRHHGGRHHDDRGARHGGHDDGPRHR
jgi:hypothetical protein